MSSARNRQEPVSVSCPVRMPYGLTARRRSRNAAAAGMIGVMTLSMLSAFVLYTERTLTVPAMQSRKVAFVQTQFRTIPASKTPQPEMKKLLAQNSTFEIPEQPRQEARPEPAAEKKPEPEVRTEPERAPKPVPKPKKKPKPVEKTERKVSQVREKADSLGTQSEKTGSASGTAGVSLPGAAGSEKPEADRKGRALAVLLQAVEKYKQYPRQGRRSGAEGTCRLLVHVSSDGTVDSCTLSGESGRAVLDAAARRLGEKLVGLNVGTEGGFHVLIPVHYRLTDR